MIVIIDYDAGNIRSVEKAFQLLGFPVTVTRDPDVIAAAPKLLLPGVGAFGDAMNRLHQYGLVEPIKQAVKNGKPFLGICLGMQLLFHSSEESPGIEGLKLLSGKILRIPDREGIKIPQTGWNTIDITPGSKLLHGLKESPYVYFVHSYYLKAENLGDVAAKTEYSTILHTAVEHHNLFGCQFHPEKSGDIGLKILDNFGNL